MPSTLALRSDGVLAVVRLVSQQALHYKTQVLPDDLQYLDPSGKIRVTKNQVPHWQQNGSTYFLTFRQQDALPMSVKKRWQAEKTIWLINNPEPWTQDQEDEFHRKFSYREERALDKGYGSCVLRDPRCRTALANRMMFRNGQFYDQISWVIMPNHVHVLASLRPGHTLEKS